MERSVQITTTVLLGRTAPDFVAAQNAGARVTMNGVDPQFDRGMAIQVNTKGKFLVILVAPRHKKTLDNEAYPNIAQFKSLWTPIPFT